MTKTERTLTRAANIHWPESAADLLLVYRAYHAAGRELSMWAAASICVLLTTPSARAESLQDLRRRLPRSTRSGPKAARAAVAEAALDRLAGRAA